MHFGRLLTAMVTPFDKENRLNLAATTELIEHLIQNGTETLVITGTTGESPTLSLEEMERLYEHVVSVVEGRIPIIAGTGTNNTTTTVQLTNKAEHYGVDGIMLVAPYYNRPNQRGLYEHFATVASSTSLPIMLYNIPGRCSVNIEAETVIELSEIDNIVALKEANGNLDGIGTILEKSTKPFYVYSGDDNMTLPILAIGGTGVVSVASHIIGNELKEMIEAFFNSDLEKASALHRTLLPVMKVLFTVPSPAPIKCALKDAGIDVGSVRMPLATLTEDELQTMRMIINEQKLKQI